MNSSKTWASIFDDSYEGAEYLDVDSSGGELLNKLTLPKVVTAESLAEVITACILKKAYLTPCRWSKWILLAALDELLGRPSPTLNSNQLQELQKDRLKASGFEVPTNLEDCVSKPSALSHHGWNRVEERSHLPRFEDISIKEESQQSASKSENILKEENDNYEFPLILDKSVAEKGVQCTPMLMGIVRNQRTQIKNLDRQKGLLKTAFTQTEFLPLCNSVSCMTEQHIMITCASQTDPVLKVDFGMQTASPWRLIKMTPSYKQQKKVKHSKFLNLGTLRSTLKVFHERPLIGAASKLTPPFIPLEPLSCLPELENLLLDPRVRSPDDPSPDIGQSVYCCNSLTLNENSN